MDPGLDIGDRVPDLRLGDATGAVRSLYDLARGLPLVVSLLPGTGDDAARAHLGLLGALAAAQRAHCVVVLPPNGSAQAAAASGFPGVVLIDDEQASGARALRCTWGDLERGNARVAVLDPNQRLLARFDGPAELAAVRARDVVSALDLYVPAARVQDMAPALLVPRVLDADYCRWLITQFHERGSDEGGTHSFEGGRPVHAVDRSFKSRRDHHVKDPDLHEGLTRRVGGCIVPEVHKAFCYRITRAEEFKITCYRTAEGGHFSAHRDNLAPQTAHRRFALTINLNDDFEGGELRFPEYGRHLYRPPPGEAIVFSCSLLHEALPVTAGDRYVLVAFLYGDDGVEQKREIARALTAAGAARMRA